MTAVIPETSVPRRETVAAMARLEAELWGRRAWSEKTVRTELDAPARHYFLAVPDRMAADPAAVRADDIVAYAGFWYDGDDAEVMNVDVARAFQRRGIGRMLFDAMVGRARRLGCRRMLLEVSVLNDPALALYRSLGFERMGLRRRYYQPEGVDAYTMALELEPRVVGFAPAATTMPDGREDGR